MQTKYNKRATYAYRGQAVMLKYTHKVNVETKNAPMKYLNF